MSTNVHIFKRAILCRDMLWGVNHILVRKKPKKYKNSLTDISGCVVNWCDQFIRAVLWKVASIGEASYAAVCETNRVRQLCSESFL